MYGGALTIGDARVDVINCVFFKNVLEGGTCPQTNPPTANCFRGGALNIACTDPNVCEFPSSHMTNCTFVDNECNGPVVGGGSAKGGGMHATDKHIVLKNCIFWGNKQNGVVDEEAQIALSGEVPIVQNSTIENLIAGGDFDGIDKANIASQPIFVDRPIGNLRPMRGSPGNDAGINDLPGPDQLDVLKDLDGQMRFDNDPGVDGGDELIDMGAYEYNTDACASANDCGTVGPDDSVIDECYWYDCVDSTCDFTRRIRFDAGGPPVGPPGAQTLSCPPDGFCNNYDKSHVLLCFANLNPCDDINMDLGGAFGACPPDGFCNLFDANHVTSCFAKNNPCTCSACGFQSSQSAMQGPGTGEATGLVAIPVQNEFSANVKRVRIYTSGALADIRGYQLDPVVSGGTIGQLELLNITIEPRDDFVFAGRSDTFEAFNLTNGQMLCGLNGDGVATTGPAYLATYTYRLSPTAAGDFVMDVRRNEAAGDQTFLVGTGDTRIDISATTPGVITATPSLIP